KQTGIRIYFLFELIKTSHYGKYFKKKIYQKYEYGRIGYRSSGRVGVCNQQTRYAGAKQPFTPGSVDSQHDPGRYDRKYCQRGYRWCASSNGNSVAQFSRHHLPAGSISCRRCPGRETATRGDRGKRRWAIGWSLSEICTRS